MTEEGNGIGGAPGDGGQGAHQQGGDAAEGYVPPQPVKAKPRPSSPEQQKVQINAGSRSRLAQTQPAIGLTPDEPPPIPGSRLAKTQPGVVLPPPAEPPLVPGAQSEQRPPAGPPAVPAQAGRHAPPPPNRTPVARHPAPGSPPTGSPPAGSPPRALGQPGTLSAGAAPPRTLGHPGALTVAAAPPRALGGPGAATTPAAPVLAETGPHPSPASEPQVSPLPDVTPTALPTGGQTSPQSPVPLTATATSEPAVEAAPSDPATAAAAPEVATTEGGHPLESTLSLWSADNRVDAELLPSAMGMAPAAPSFEEEAELAPAAVQSKVSPRGGNRAAMTLGLAIVAVALIVAVIFFAVGGDSGSDDPEAVKWRDDGRRPAPTAKSTATATAKVKPPVQRPIFRRPPPKKKPREDIYEDE